MPPTWISRVMLPKLLLFFYCNQMTNMPWHRKETLKFERKQIQNPFTNTLILQTKPYPLKITQKNNHYSIGLRGTEAPCYLFSTSCQTGSSKKKNLRLLILFLTSHRTTQRSQYNQNMAEHNNNNIFTLKYFFLKRHAKRPTHRNGELGWEVGSAVSRKDRVGPGERVGLSWPNGREGVVAIDVGSQTGLDILSGEV